MEYKKDIEPINSKGQKHGYHEYYEQDDKIWLRATYKNGKLIGYREVHDDIIIVKATIYSII
jgi:antitoxin component YwqK of YwqJK toxin-antitoxin module